MSRANRGEGTRAVTVAATTAPNSVTPITSPCRLMGWSLAAGLIGGKAATGSVTSPAALQNIASIASVPAGEYTLNWQVELGGTLSATDVNNFEVTVIGVLQVVSLNPGTAGVYPQNPIQIVVPAGGGTVSVKAVALATVGAVYSANFTLTGGTPMEANILDSGQAIGQTACPQGSADTQLLSDDGIYVSTNVTITVIDGTVSGVIYVRDGVEPDMD